MKPAHKLRDRVGKLLAAVLMGFGVAIVAFGICYHNAQKSKLEQAARDTLNAVADLKVAQVREWRDETLGDANWVFHGSTLGNDLSKLTAGRIDDAAMYRRTVWLTMWQRYQQFSRVLLVSPTGDVLLAAPTDRGGLEPQAQEFIARTLAEKTVLVWDLHQSVSSPGAVKMDIFVPLIDRPDVSATGQIVGVLMLETDPNAFLYPLIDKWPTPSQTSETLLVRRDGDEVLYLNELRHRKDTALKLKLPITNRQVPAVRAVLGEEGIVEGPDYRGKPVLAALRKIPDSPWFIVAKQDRAEILAPLRQQAWTTGVAVGGLILSVMLSLALLWRRRERLFAAQASLERREVEIALRESEAHYRSLFESMMNGFAYCRMEFEGDQPRDFTYLKVNAAFEKQTGLKNVSGKKISEVIPGIRDIDPGLFERYGRVAKTGVPERFEIYVQALQMWFAISVYCPAKGDFVSIFDVITERKQAETELRESKAKLDAALASMTDAVFISDAAGHFVEFNDAFATFHRFKSKAECAKTFSAYPDLLDVFLPNGELAPVENWAVPRALRGEVATNAEYTLRRKDTGETWVGSYSFSPIRDQTGAIVGSVVAGRDITERKRAEEALRGSEDRLRRAIANSPFPIMLHAEDGAVLQISNAWCEITGYTREELATMSDWADHAYGEKKVLVQADIERLYGLDHRKAEGDYAIRTKGGNTRIWEFSSAPLGRLADGRRLVISMAMDVTERRSVETEVRRLNDELEQRVAARTAELEASNKELEAFAYSVSHDLRAPLRAIDGFAHILDSDYMARLDLEGQRILKIVRSEARRMGQLIDDLLAFSRLSRQPMQSGAIDMTVLAKTIFDECAAQSPGRQLQLDLRPLPATQGDPSMVRQALVNLISNAIKYTRPKNPAKIEIGCQQEEDENIYYVKDNGVGFDPKYAGKLFGVFQRLHTDDEFEGTGVGLALVQRIVHRHGGRVWAEAEVNKGATIYFSLPKKSNP